MADKPDSEKKSYSETVANKIIEQLEQGTAPWQKPWQPGELELPHNPTTGKEYKGINALWLHMQGRDDPRWMTYNQAGNEGAQVRKGEKGSQVVYWKFSDEKKETDEQGKPVIDPETGKQKTITVQLERPRSFTAVVFNAEQIDGLPPREPKAMRSEPERHARAEAILSNSGADIRHEEGNRAFYRPSTDSITLPERSQFPTSDNYYATALHEVGHWTGHPSRLDRDLSNPFGSEGYAREELRAEIASLMIGERLDIGHDPSQHAAYVGSWIKALKEDPREIFRAAADAERISAFVMGFEHEKTQEQATERQQGAATAPEVASELQRDHEAAADGYSPLESWQMMKAEAERSGYTAQIDFAPETTASAGAAYQITYSDRQGQPTDIRTEVYADGKMMTEQKGDRLSANISNHPEGQPATLAAAIEQHEQAKKTAAEQAPQAAIPPRAVLHEQPEKAMDTRTYLAVPYAEKNEAKAEGAKWDKEAKAWYAEAGVDVATSGLARWSLDKPGVVKAAEPDTPEKQFIQALKDAGLDTQAATDKKDHPVADGKIHRVPTAGEKGGGTSGAYAFHKDPQPDGTSIVGGFIQNYKTGAVVHWKPEGKSEQLTAEQRAEQATQAAKAREMREAARGTENDATAKAAKALWDESPPATGNNAYCKIKGITDPKGVREVPATISPEAAALGIKIAKTAKQAKELREADPNNRVFKAGDLLVPGLDSSGKLHTLQSVNPYFKSLMKGGRKAGLFSVAGADDPIKALADQDPKNPLVIAEGYATADTVSRLKGGGPVVVAFDSGNLSAVADELRGRFPNRGLLFAADNDHNAEKQTGFDGKPKVNVGLVKAKEAAEKHGGGVIVPKFKDGDKGSDWNDVATASGDEAARRMFGDEMAVAKRDAAISAERLTSLARTRDMEARNDPTTSADDAKVASERGHASEVLAGAQSQLSEVRSMAADGLTGAAKGNVKGAAAPAAVKAGIARKTEAMHDQANEEREQVLNHPQGTDGAAVSWKKLPEKAKQNMIEAVKSGKEVTLPKDAPAQLKKMAGQEPTPRSRSRGVGIEM